MRCKRRAGQSPSPYSLRIARAEDQAPILPMPDATPIGRGAQRRVSRKLREAALAASPSERVDLDRLSVLLSTGDVTLPQADDMLRELLRAQNQRRAA